MSKNNLFLSSNKFIAGKINEKKDAAIIIPALLPSAILTKFLFVLFAKKTKEAPPKVISQLNTTAAKNK